MLFMALALAAVVVYWLNGKGPLWIDYAALVAIGFLIYGPIMLIGLQSLDLVPKKAAGTAAGFTGFLDRKSTRLNSSHLVISYAVFCLKKKKNKANTRT